MTDAASAAASLPTLTDEQVAVVRDTDGHLIVEAGAGSGKTTTIVAKMLHEMGLTENGGPAVPDPLTLEEIGAITFTRKAAGELKEKLRAQLLGRAERASGLMREHWGEQAFAVDEARISTIDAFAGRLIRDFGGLAGVETGFEILDPGDAQALHQEVAEAAILAGIEVDDEGATFLVRQFGFLRAREIVARAFDQADRLEAILAARDAGEIDWDRYRFELTAVDRLLEPKARALLAFLERAHERLVGRMENDGVYDHTHVVLRAADLADHPDVRRALEDEIRLLFVDEHQDTSRAQMRLLFRLAGIEEAATDESSTSPPRLRLVLVGDPKQGIYGFRNADIRLWKRSRKAIEAAGGHFHTLTTNHRSRPTLIRFFDSALGRVLGEFENAKNRSEHRYEVPYRSLKAGRPETAGDGVELLLADETGSEHVAGVVAERVADMLAHPDRYPVHEVGPGGEEAARPVRPRDIAILSPTLKNSAADYERELRERGIDSYIYGGRGLYGRQEVQDLAALLRTVADPHDPFALAALLRSPLGGLDDATLAELAAASTAAPEAESVGSLYEALRRSEAIVGDAERARRAREAFELVERLRELRDRKPHHELLEIAIAESGYRAFLAGAPDSPAGLRNVEKLLRIAQRSSREPLFEFVERLEARVRRADPEEEAPLYTPDDDLITISTVHKAKGLEWPYVILTGLDERLFWRVRQSEPHLTTDFGVALPLDVVIRDNESEVPAAAPSRVWETFRADATRREYAEAKRLFYVACTRARDRLLLAGALDRETRPRSLSKAIEYRHYQGAEYWLRHLYPSITASGDASRSFSYGPGAPAQVEPGRTVHQPDEARIRRGRAEMAAHGSARGGRNEGERGWPKAIGIEELGGIETAPLPEEVAERTGDLTARTPIRREVSASEILKFASCPWKHFFGYRAGISSPSLEVQSADARINLVLPRKRGDILHDYLLEHRHAWSEERRHEEMRRALLRHLPMGEEAADENAAEILEHARHYFESEWYERAQQALESHREVPFTFELTDALRVTGQIDFLFREADGWRLLDFKAGLFRGVEDRLHEEIDHRVRAYEPQAALYTMGARAALAGEDVRSFTFFFTAPGEARTLEVADGWPDRLEGYLARIVDSARRGAYGDVPVYGPRKCRGCEYLPICQPEGAPETGSVAQAEEARGDTSPDDAPAPVRALPVVPAG